MKQSSHIAKLQVFPFVFFLPEILSGGTWVLPLFFSLFLPFSSNAQAPPNVLFILTDDLAWGDLHCHGNDSVSTPNLDRLAEESVQFDRFYVGPAGASTRAGLLTGRYALRTGVSGEAHRRQVIRAGEVTMAEVFRGAGYRTALFGKWENGAQYPNDPTGQGFEEFLGFCGDYLPDYSDALLTHNRDTLRTEGFITDALTDKAIGYISGNREQPFFCLLAYNTPHSHSQCPAAYFDKYKKAGLTDKNAAVYGLVENIDDNVGRLLKALDSLGIRDHTYIVFLSDNGPGDLRFNGGLRGQKGSLYEGGLRVPCFIHRRNYLAPRHLPKPAADIDLLPTLTGLCEFPLPGAIQPDGVNFSRIMLGAPDFPGDRMLFFQFSDGKTAPSPGAVVSGRFSLILDKTGRSGLYNVTNDPGQTRNLADSLAKVAAILKNSYLNWYADVTRAGTEPAPVPVDGRKGSETRLPVSDRDTTASRRPTDNIIRPGDLRQDVWLDARDSVIRWMIDVPERGVFDISLQYSCDSLFAGSMVVLVTDGSEVKITVDEPSRDQLPASQYRVPGEQAIEKSGKTVSAGRELLESGVQMIRVYLPYGHKGEVEVKGLVLKRL